MGKTSYEILGYKTQEDFENRNFENLDFGISTKKQAIGFAKELFRRGNHAVIKLQSEDREFIELFENKKMKKVAKLVTVSLCTRVIVDENATDEEIVAAAKKGLNSKIKNDELIDNLDGDNGIIDDKECPCGTLYEDVYYQPDFDTLTKKERNSLFSFSVFKSKKNAQEAFPKATIITYTNGDIEEPSFIDKNYIKEKKKK